MKRRDFLWTLAGGAAALPQWSRAQAPPVQTHVYKTVGNCQIKADLHQAASDQRKPAVVWIHGGALIMGGRRGIDRGFQAELLKSGFVMVSIDYRLAPETKLPGIIQDVQDAWNWLRHEGPGLGIDPDRLATAGGSAGGYLTLMTGFCLNPRPRALVSYFGYGDITTPWYARPDEFYRRQALVSKDEAYGAVGDTVLAEQPTPSRRGRFYLYCRQNGLWPKEVTGHDPDLEPKWFDPYCPIRNLTAKYPPTFLIHGTADTDVPYTESKNMADKLKETGVEHEFVTVQGAGHGLSGARPDEVARIAGRAAAFVAAHAR
ncbi:MAG: alpha/beta hydrolase [Verrucomicrobiota bacterium]|jgi:acetyl esterase/lipase